MIGRAVIKRLEVLETRIVPASEPRRFEIQYVDRDKNVVSTRVVEAPAFAVPALGTGAPRVRGWRS